MLERVHQVGDEGGGGRLDRVLAAAWPDLSRSRLQALIRDGRVTVDHAVVRDPAAKPALGAALVLQEPEPTPAEPRPEAMALAVVFEDEDLVVVDKPAGLVVHPGPGHESGTLVNGLLAHCGPSLSGIGGVLRPGIVHRIDKDTSGLLMVAKSERAHASLSAQLADHGRTGPLERAYLAFVWGVPEPRRGTVDAPLARSHANREKIVVVGPNGGGRHAVTHYALSKAFAGADGQPLASLVRCELETGRTHQIRVHLAHLHHPLIGDATYGAGYRTKVGRLAPGARALVADLGRQALHATILQFAHPRTGEVMRFESPLPPDLTALEQALSERSGTDLSDLRAPDTNSVRRR